VTIVITTKMIAETTAEIKITSTIAITIIYKIINMIVIIVSYIIINKIAITIIIIIAAEIIELVTNNILIINKTILLVSILNRSI